jgi:hypothetical protein
MQTRSWCLFALLAGCASRELPGEPELGWTPSDDSDIGPVYMLVSDRSNDDTSARVHVVDVSEPGGGGDRAVVFESPADIEDPELSPSRRWAAIGNDLHLIDFAGDPLEPARAVERPGPGSFNPASWSADRFAADDSGLITLFTPDGDERGDLYYVPLLESGPLVPLEVTMPDSRWPSASHRISDDGRWLVFFGDDDDDGFPAGIYVSEIIGGQPSPAALAHEASPPLWLGEELQVAGGAAFFETWADSPDIRDLQQLRRLDLETFEVQTLTDLEPESRQWFASADGSRVLFKSGGYGEGSIDYVEIIAGEPQPATLLSFGGDELAWADWAGFLTPDGRYGLVQANVGYDTFVAWFDFEGPTPTQPVGVEAVLLGAIDWDGRWISSATPDGRLLLIDPVLGLVQKIDLPPPWLATHVRIRPEGTRIELLATEGPTINDLNDGAWTLRTADELGPPLRFDHPTQPGQVLPIWWNAEYIPTSERHVYRVDEGGERWTIWENDGFGSRTALMEVEGEEVTLLVVAPQW